MKKELIIEIIDISVIATVAIGFIVLVSLGIARNARGDEEAKKSQ